ncbi:MAG TPA: GSCFA domain-containing protein [Phnomibacter sp.]|nr:GSCFA domain-containing protein [Phnomibacter sp.]
MNFRLELTVKPLPAMLNIRDKVALMGSCFTDHMSTRLRSMKFSVLENPNGIVFNPISIENAIQSYIAGRVYSKEDLFYFNELWSSWSFHGKFSQPEPEACLQAINASVQAAHAFLKDANWLILTLGSAFVYELKDANRNRVPGAVAANCHKVPANEFVHRLLSLSETTASLHRTIDAIRSVNPAIRILFTVSPVRHYREGLVENNRSKATLQLAVQDVVQNHEQVFYFPSYELIIDDLRDYRFYAEDLVHPNHAATQYVWEKFAASCIDAQTNLLMVTLEQIRIGMMHRPHHPGSSQHQKFLRSMYEKATLLKKEFPFLELEEELDFFGKEL